MGISKTPQSLGWAEIGVGIATFGVALNMVALVMGFAAPDRPVLQGVIGSFGGGIAGIAGFGAVFAMRRRSLAAFGIRYSTVRWSVIASVMGVVGYGLSLIIVSAYQEVAGHHGENPQAILHAAARGGAWPFLLSFLGGAVLTPIGEELLFRGVIANALNKYGAWAGVGLSSVIFGLVHGWSVVLWVAIMVGLLSAILLRRTGSVWPCIVLHAVYNGLHTVESALSGSTV
ncbi:CPBP family intramembrane glutamic endopeptidase [Pararhizobium sp. PWRC1-1]|uniref:CPBP family intramembrane glutamic endopeptidase n=1 Tax=Pararhizobium sp. PWRC1-1 TaxID=2804566 RepID=UPI003CEDB153